ncbi:hypothetical protein HYU22_02095 [Candidatus Woesearchaeota archaeon]|nr:hypothetical protein [Candidatus Woesearchaeota archaeon]
MDHCPTCEHEVQDLRDYPLIQINAVSRVPLPEYIGSSIGFVPLKKTKGTFPFGTKVIDNPDIPDMVFQELRGGGKKAISFAGYIWQIVDTYPDVYTLSKDITSDVMSAVNGNLIQQSLSTLESLVGKDISTKELRNSLSIGLTFPMSGHNDGQLQLYDRGRAEGSAFRSAQLCLEAGRLYIRPDGLHNLYHLDLAAFQYDGRFKA